MGSVFMGLMTTIEHRPIGQTVHDSLYLEKGQGMLRAAYLAKQSGAIKQSWHFKALATLKGVSKRLQAGEYRLSAEMTPGDLIQNMLSGDVMVRTITIPEGFSTKQILQLFQATPTIEMAGLTTAPEGIFAPDTYHYLRGTTAKDLLARMQSNQSIFLQELWDNRPADFPFQSMDEVLTLASLIEKETSLPEERSIIAAVFLHRLEKGMRLQTDPTVIYGITYGLPLERGLTRAELRAETAYNTYKIKGLPPTPIANPGKASIRAVFEPAAVDYLYFVADGTGGHHFAVSYEDHQKNVRKWRQIERQRTDRKSNE